jgi:uncharacterized delta-60 repeat protein
LLAEGALGEAGRLDHSFGSSGVVTTAIGNGDSNAGGVALQPDGKILAAGSAAIDGQRRFALVRYRGNGSRDPAFGQAGTVTTAIGSIDDSAGDLVVEPSGKIAAAGVSFDGSADRVALVQYNSDGSLDTSFGTDGKTTAQLGKRSDASGVALQPDGKLVTVGSAGDGRGSDIALARFQPDGSLDPHFGAGGKVAVNFGGGDDFGTGVAIQRDGKIVAVGSAQTNGDVDAFAVARINQDGSRDPSFGEDGQVMTPIGSGSASAIDVVIQPDGKIVAVGAGVPGFVLVRYRPDGSLDHSFGIGGVATTQVGSGSLPYAVGLQRDGKLVVAGYSYSSAGVPRFAIVRFKTNGALDRAFGQGGAVTTRIGSEAFADAIAVQRDGKIVVAGVALLGSHSDIVLARYLSARVARDSCRVPAMTGKPLPVAKQELAHARCSLGAVRRVFSSKVRRGRVIVQHPRAGVLVARDTRVRLVVSKGEKHRP